MDSATAAQDSLRRILDGFEALRALEYTPRFRDLGTVRLRPSGMCKVKSLHPRSGVQALSAHARLQARDLEAEIAAAARALQQALSRAPTLAFWNPDITVSMANNGPLDTCRLTITGCAWCVRTETSYAGSHLDTGLALLRNIPLPQDAPRRTFDVGDLRLVAPNPQTALVVGAALIDPSGLLRDAPKILEGYTPAVEIHPADRTLAQALSMLGAAGTPAEPPDG